MTTSPAVELRESRSGLWLRARRLRIALLIALVESILVVASEIGWFWVLGAAVVTVAFYAFAGREARYHIVREVAWIAAASQLIAVIVPVLWEVVKVVAVIALVAIAVVLLVMLLADRR